ncbi:hypothetical protein [Halobacillus kuroshimensis]|uniref:hypothetical protein n=1 Tax=Halobacillus kuroshimensis TaxID=302481 RepID=UPI00041D2550|nr:hypothetical protein [Halobacillus kuroshimensis]
MNVFLTNLVIPFIWLGIVGVLSGSQEFIFKPKEDERKQWIKQKAVIQSWSTIILFMLANLLFEFFNGGDPRLEGIKTNYPELFYLTILFLSYCVFYFINSRKVSV